MLLLLLLLLLLLKGALRDAAGGGAGKGSESGDPSMPVRFRLDVLIGWACVMDNGKAVNQGLVQTLGTALSG
jgi:hypothetical protein